MDTKKKRIISYGPTIEETIVVDSLTDELRFVKCMKLYKSHETMEALDNAIKKKALNKIDNII